MKSIMLVLTQMCNLRCSYCYEQHNGQKLDYYSIKKIIDKEYEDTSDLERQVYFFGGEPFIEFDLIKQTVDYIENKYSNFRTSYSVTTNGTLVHGDIKKFLIKLSHRFEIVLSIDGNKKMHDLNRCFSDGKGSFDKIDLDFFSSLGSKAKMTITPDTLDSFAEGIMFIESKGLKCKANFASGVDFCLDENSNTLWNEMNKLIKYYSKNTEQQLCFMLDLPLADILVPLDNKFRYCDAGCGRHCYSDSEDWYPCQGLMPFAVSDDRFKCVDLSRSSVLDSSPCNNCSFVRICKACYASNYLETKNVYNPDEQTCKLNKACILTSARIQYNRLKNRSPDSYSDSDKQLIMAILRIANELDNKK